MTPSKADKTSQRDAPSMVFEKDGPIRVQGLPGVRDEAGHDLPARVPMALCRCGHSRSKPSCDGTHAQVGFTDAKTTDGEWDKRVSYPGKGITIHDNRGVCSHAGHCTSALPSVWRMKTEPWIDPDGAPVEAIVAAIRRCPSGALSYSIDGVEHRDRDVAPSIQASKDGPFLVEGGIALEGVPRGEGASSEHGTLCRCGESKNKPFCDGTHWYVHFKSDNSVRVADFGELPSEGMASAKVDGVDLVIVRSGNEVTALEGTCAHQGARLADGTLESGTLACALHGWAYDAKTGANRDDSGRDLKAFRAWTERDAVFVDADEVAAWKAERTKRVDVAGGPSPRTAAGTPEEPHNAYIRQLAEDGLAKTGPHGPTVAMGVPRYDLPSWDDLQILTAQLHTLPQLDDVPVATELMIGPRAKKPLRLEIPLFVSDMSFGSLSEEAKTALAKGADRAGTGICSGEGGMLPEEQQSNRRYLYELASARFGFTWKLLSKVQAFHFKGGQAAKTGTGGHLPGDKVSRKIAEVRGLQEGQTAVSPARFPDWSGVEDFARFAGEVRERTGGIPIGFKLSAQHIEEDLEAALRAGVDYVILDGRGGGTGAAPAIFRDHISVPTMPAIARARRYLDRTGNGDVTLIATGGLRTPADFVKAMALGADGVAIANTAIQAIGCIATRACNTNQCPVGIATQREELRARLNVEDAARKLHRFLAAAVQLMSVLARACGHTRLDEFSPRDLTTWKREIAALTGVHYAGEAVDPLR